jgi:hypothetical protein
MLGVEESFAPAEQLPARAAASDARVLFTVTSALNVSPAHSRFSNAQRLEQTVATLASARACFPNADFLIADGSMERPSDADIARLGPRVQFGWFGQLPEMREIARHPDFNIVKNVSELTIYANLLNDLIVHNALTPYARVFKLSGRYFLNEHFSPVVHLSPEAREKFVFSRRTPATWNIAHVGTTYAWQTRLFSYDPELAHLLGSLYMVSLRAMHGKLARGIYTDIEHSVARYLNPNLVFEVDAIGVSGDIGTYELHIAE